MSDRTLTRDEHGIAVIGMAGRFPGAADVRECGVPDLRGIRDGHRAVRALGHQAVHGGFCLVVGGRAVLRRQTVHADERDVETDAGEQTRLLRFGADAASATENSWQGFTTAQWTTPVGGFDLRALLSGRQGPPSTEPPKGSLKAETTHLRAGYLRKNGLPYSDDAKLTEYFSRVSGFGNDYLTVLSIVRDPMYLNGDYVTSSHFKREPDDSSFSPSPCRTAPPRAGGGE